MVTYQDIILLCWAAFIVFWTVLAFNIKRDVRGGYRNWWQQFWLLRIIAATAIVIFVMTHFTEGPESIFFSRGIYVPPLLLGWIAAAISVIGVGCAIWARVHLGRNWSPHPSMKVDHELVTTGPYAYVRHPIYTGMILMAFGALLSGSFSGIIIFIVASIIFISRIGREEKIMLKLFPNEYPAYQKRTKRLVPFVW